MNSNLAGILFNLGVLSQNTEVDAIHEVEDIGGIKTHKEDIFTILQAKPGNKHVWILATRNRDGLKVKLKDDSVTKIDGMKPERLALSYNLKPDGRPAVTGKKRGRKPKSEKQAA